MCVSPYVGINAANWGTREFMHEASGQGWSTASRPAMSMSSSSPMLTQRAASTPTRYTSFGATAGVLPARSIMNNNLDNAFAGQSASSIPGRSIRRDGRDDPDNPPDPATPVGDIPWVLMVIMAAAYVLWRRRKETAQETKARPE